MSARPWRIDGEDVLLSIRLTPRSAKEGLGGIWTDEHGATWLMAHVRAVPEKGRANSALIGIIAKALDVAPGKVSLEAGDTNRLKRIRIAGAARDIERKMGTELL